jgi:CheY-like chemotaxis protein
LLENATEVARTGKGLRFVVADDDPVFLTLARSLLKSAYSEADIVCVTDGNGAIEAIRDRAASLMVLDLEMPEMRGVEVVRALRDNPETTETPVVIVTGEGGASDWRELSALGTAGFLVKPVDLGALLALVRRLVEV